jgi:putative lipoprotein (rSAM/lipoprotein system)
MKVRFNRWYNAVLTALLSLLGYGCSSSSDDYEIPIEYGSPYTTYEISGKVTDENGLAVKDIKVSTKYVLKDDDGNVWSDLIDSVQTDKLGKYKMRFSKSLGEPQIKLLVEDIDGDANGGAFRNDTLEIDYDGAIKINDSDPPKRWSQGNYAINQDIILKKK